MAIVLLPSEARHITGGDTRLVVEGRTVAELIANLNRQFAGMESLLGNENGLGPGIAVAIDGIIRGREIHRLLDADSEVCFLPAIFSG